ncbi:transcription termination factor Rho [Candidatus Dojkabacteria bacterium]|uniref:Transcription termination factor Rho n=1 Tax=Candidatus Dojkabacteria bacterium TaxID=2099670 RepID=A0A955LB05_9BACT|nr:transcription termination factor Rho [Candidatus Dojkabacteria bacterium]
MAVTKTEKDEAKKPIRRKVAVTAPKSIKKTTNAVETATENPIQSTNTRKDTIVKATSLKDLEAQTLADLRKLAKELEIKDPGDFQKKDLILEILAEQTKRGGNIFAEGFLEIIKDSHGVLRSLTMLPGDNDVYVSSSQIKRFNLRQGDYIAGQARPPKEGERYLGLLKIEAINNDSPDKAISRPTFNRLTPIYPDEQIKLETDQHTLATRVIDLLAPIGKGQRGMIVAPPKAGKTWLLKDIAAGIAANHPDIHLMVVLVGERPEEVTDLQRFVQGEVIAANFDEPPENHTKIAEMAVERAKRLVENGRDVVILMDSITRLARAYNLTAPPSGRTLSGGFDPVAIYPPKKFFGAARNMENGGSLTIIATALVDTGSKMDEVIFEEFKGTGNMEVKLDRKLAGKRIFPSIDVTSSYTRNEDKLLSPEVLAQTWRVVRMLDTLQHETNTNPTETLLERIKKTKNNEEFLATLHEAM